MTQVEKDEFEADLKLDALVEAHREIEDAKREYVLSTDYEAFMEEYEEEFTNVSDAIRILKKLHEIYEHDWDIRELEGNL